MEQRILSILKKRKYIMAVVVIILVSSATALTWMWLSNTIEDDVEVTNRPMTLTLLESPDGIWKGTLSTWTFNLSVDYDAVTTLWFWAHISWDEYNSTEDYGELIGWQLNGSSGGILGHGDGCWRVASDILGPDGTSGYQWQTGEVTCFTFGIWLDTQMPVGNYHFEFAVRGQLA